MQRVEKLFIGGDWVAPSSGDRIDVISPHSEEIVGSVPEAKKLDVDRAVIAARTAFEAGGKERDTNLRPCPRS